MSSLKLISFDLCPFVQRSVITLLEKKQEVEIEYIDLNAKPDWFLKISPFGKVPVLQVGDTTLFESAVINEYIDETVGARLHPEDPLERAIHRAWIEFGSGLLMENYRLSMAKTDQDAKAIAESIRSMLARLEEQVALPYFSGDAFSLVDAALAPALQRMQWCENIVSMDLFDNTPRVAQWRDALLERDSVKASLKDGTEAIFVDYLRGKGSPTRDAEPSWLGRKSA